VEACEGDDISRVSGQVRGWVELGRLDERYGGQDKLENRHDNWERGCIEGYGWRLDRNQ
jgi:hypothetical protein